MKMDSHAYIIFCEDDILRREKAYSFAVDILCKNGGCGECLVCKKVLSDNHQDIKFLNQNSKFTVKDSEKLIDDTYIKGYESDTKIYFIDNAHTLSPQVQNKLLKIYEEPPKGCVIVLLAKSDGRMLKTILSRAEKIYIASNLKEDYEKKLLEPNAQEMLNEAFNMLSNCKKSSDIASFIKSPAFEKENISLFLDFLEVVLGDILKIASRANLKLICEREYDINVLANGFSSASVAMSLLSCAKARQKLQSNISPLTVGEGLLFEILESKYKLRNI
ncbi:MAG: hypothetical protein FWD49_00370 [Firmicutes bacterium]|nr:hypothetical protein [Bacillota bacterium]